MKQKLVCLFIALLMNRDIFELVAILPQNGVLNTVTSQMEGCNFVETVENEEEKKEGIVEEQKQEELKEVGIGESQSIFEDNQKEDKCLNEETENKENVQTEKVSEVQADEDVYNVAFPTNSKVYLDPGNLSGKGQIFSDDYKVENYGNTDIAIKIKNIHIYYQATEEVYELSEMKVSDRISGIKKINVDVIWKNEIENTEKVLNVKEGTCDEYVLVLKASIYDENNNFIGFGEGSVGSFYFTGTVNSSQEFNWEDGEVTISFGYEIVKIEEEINEEPISQNEDKKQDEQENEKAEMVDSQEEIRQNKQEYEEQQVDKWEYVEEQMEQEEQGVSNESL